MRVFFALGLVRAIIGGLIGSGLGMAIVTGIRASAGLPAWSAPPASAAGAFTGVVGFLVGVGALRDWARWVGGRERPSDRPSGAPASWTRYLGFNTNHKVIGIQYMATSLLLMFFAGPLGILDRVKNVAPGPWIIDPGIYNSAISVHGITMLTMTLIGISGLMNYLVPLMIGARDMAFPRLNAFSFWVTPPAGCLLILSLFFGGQDAGWTAYPPLSVRAPLGMQFMLLGFYFAGLSSILGGVNLITTIFTMRTRGMTLFRMPVFVWSTLATAFLMMTFTQFVGMAFLLLLLERLLGFAVFEPEKGGNVVLYQHLFWFYSHPAVYIFILPGLGIISDIIPVFVRKPLFGYKMVALSSVGIALGGAWVWGHHMFAAGIEDWLLVPFMFTTLLVAVPTGVKIFSWLATIWRGKIRLATPFLFALTAIVTFLIGGLTGVVQGIVPADLHITDTYWIVAHFHHTLFGGFVFPLMAAIYYWFPKVTGRLLREGLGKVHWLMMTVGFFLLYEPMFVVGLDGMRRRVYDYEASQGFQVWNIVSAVGGFVVAISLMVMLLNIFVTLRSGIRAPENPWRARTLEWQVASPPPEDNFAVLPEVRDDPYGYGVPGSVHAVVSGAQGPKEGR
ncbi:MAG: cbb3-type cytochrome c oxidase subunit I [Dehalococcoidia bacterium]|nr:cbb3-type cytochrome c oxidase subunit I [Dehalococcoidia bacterium]